MDDRKSLTIGIDARAAQEVPAGRGRVVRELLRVLAARPDEGHRYILYARERWEHALDERFRWRLIHSSEPWWHARAARAASRECDVLFSSNSYLTPLFTRLPSVTMVHDMIAFEPSMRPNLRSTVIERLTLGAAVRRSAALLCTTQNTVEALTSRFPRARGRTALAPLAARPASAGDLDPQESEQLPPPGFVLAVGTLEPRKNLPRLVSAYRLLDERLQETHPLVVVGALGWKTGETLDSLRSLGARCKLLGYVSDAALSELYRRCAVFCYPSLGEGFGLPVLEAMQSGAAVLASSLSSLPEVGGDAVEYADPRDVTDIAAGLRAILSDPTRAQQLRDRARERATEFSWEQFAEITLETLESVAALHRSSDRAT